MTLAGRAREDRAACVRVLEATERPSKIFPFRIDSDPSVCYDQGMDTDTRKGNPVELTTQQKFEYVNEIAPENVWMDGELNTEQAIANGAAMYDRAHASGEVVRFCGCPRCSR